MSLGRSGLPDGPDDRSSKPSATYKETRRLYGVLDRRLGEVEFTAGEISIADFAILGWAWRHERHQVDLADFPNVKRWYETLMARPGVQRGFAVALS
jgi:GSH-dependent disulfide-bond oxidoreductase